MVVQRKSTSKQDYLAQCRDKKKLLQYSRSDEKIELSRNQLQTRDKTERTVHPVFKIFH